MVDFRSLGKREAALRGCIRKGFNIWSEKTGNGRGLGLQPLGCCERKIGKPLTKSWDRRESGI